MISVLAQRVRVPGCPRARLERDRIASRAGWSNGREQRVDAHVAGEPVGGALGLKAVSRLA
jgi:hypothetical protein